MTPNQQAALHAAYEASQALMPLDLTVTPIHSHTLRTLEQRRLLRQEGRNLYRITLAGLLYQREGRPPPPPRTPKTIEDKIVAFVRDHPGSTANEARDAVGAPWASSVLSRLDRQGRVTHTNHPTKPNAHAYYTPEAKPPEPPTTRQVILRHLRAHPGATTAELQAVTGYRNVAKTVRRMHRARQLRKRPTKNGYRYYPK